jgi:MYXO-CTERM domain-containing protein
MRFQTIRRATLATAVAASAMVLAPAAGLAQGTTTTGASTGAMGSGMNSATGTANTTMGPDTTMMSNTTPVRENEDHDYGWLGLLGLAGLLGLRRREPTVVRETTVRDTTGRTGTGTGTGTERDTMR